MKSGEKMKNIMKIILATFVLATIIPNVSATVTDPSLRISIGSEVFNGYTYPTVTLENSVQKLVIRTQYGGKGTGGVESVVKDWILKSRDTDIVSKYIDGNSFRGVLSGASIVNNGENSKTVRLTYARGSISEYTITANSPIIKIKYEKYDVIATSNIVDSPGLSGVSRVYGQGSWMRSITGSYYPCAYWDSYETYLGGCGVTYGPDPANAGSLNYKGNIIMSYGQTGTSGIGFGRVMPIYTGINGGIRILKIFSFGGFEPYQANANGQLTRPPHYGYIYLFQTGVDNAIIQGKQIVDGLSTSVPITVVSPNGGESFSKGTTKTIKWSSSTGSNVKIDLYKAGVFKQTIVSNTLNDGSHSWTVPSNQVVGNDYKIKITSTSNLAHSDMSNNDFKIY